jgi:putative phage integrase
MIGGIRLNKLRPMALENMLSELRKRKHHGKRINESTAQRYLSVVSAVLSDAKRNEIIEKNPARMLDLPTPQRTVQRIPTRGEVEKLLDALAKEPRHYRLFYLLSMYTGCRRGELSALQWSDFTGTQNGLLLTVSRSRSSVPGKGIVEGATKNGKSREVFSPLTCGVSSSPTSAASRWRRTSSAASSVPTSSPTSRGVSSTRTPSPSDCGRSMMPSAFRGSTIFTPCATTS